MAFDRARPVRAGDRLARLLRAGELTPIRGPDAAHQVMRDLVRARDSAAEDQCHKRQLVSAFLLRQGRVCHRTKPWRLRHRRRLQSRRFDHPASQIVSEGLLQSERTATERVDRLTEHIEALVPERELAPAVHALRALRGVGLLGAVSLMAKIGDARRFGCPVKLMADPGLVPSEHSSGKTARRGGTTRAANSRVRHKLVEPARTYRLPPSQEPRRSTSCGNNRQRCRTSPGKRNPD